MKAIIFDFNGTLFRDTDFHTKAWRQIYKELNPGQGEGPGEEFYCGPRNDVLLTRIAPWLSSEQRQEMSKYKESVYRKICEENPEKVYMVDGAKELMDELVRRKIPFILASASIKENIDFYFKTFSLEKWFDKESTVYDDGSYLDKGEMHKEAAKRLGLDISECIVIEDSVSAICHAREAGAGYVVAIGPEKKREEISKLPIDSFISDFKEWDYSVIK